MLYLIIMYIGCYLLLIHILALGYFIKVLNPSLIEDVDSLKAKWSTDTFQSVMETEHRDVRFRV